MQSVRRRITEILKERGEATVADLAGQLGMAQVSVRHHLDILVGEDLVETSGVRRKPGAGRPSQVYTLTPEAAKLFPQRHDILAAGMLGELKTLLSADEIHEMLRRLGEGVSREAPTAQPEQTLEERLDVVTEFLCEKGYNARWKAINGHYELHACNCPYVGVADSHPELCAMDQAMLQSLLPGAVRLSSRAVNGTARCTYVVEPKEGQAPAKA